MRTGRNDLGAGMSDFPIDPELRIRGRPDQVLRRTNKALNFVRQVCHRARLARFLDRFEAIQDKWSALEAVVHLEFLLEAEGRLIEEKWREPVHLVEKKSYAARIEVQPITLLSGTRPEEWQCQLRYRNRLRGSFS